LPLSRFAKIWKTILLGISVVGEVEMKPETIGYVKSPAGHEFRVKWDAFSHHLYIGGHHVGQSPNPTEALKKAEAWVRRREGGKKRT